jgi:hypothetical protein
MTIASSGRIWKQEKREEFRSCRSSGVAEWDGFSE